MVPSRLSDRCVYFSFICKHFSYQKDLAFSHSTARESRHTSMRSVLSFPAICVDHVHYRLIWRASRRCLLRQCILQDLPRGPKRAQGIFNGCGQYGGQLRYCTGWGNRPTYPQCFVFVLENQGCKLTFAVGLAATTWRILQLKFTQWILFLFWTFKYL